MASPSLASNQLKKVIKLKLIIFLSHINREMYYFGKIFLVVFFNCFSQLQAYEHKQLLLAYYSTAVTH